MLPPVKIAYPSSTFLFNISVYIVPPFWSYLKRDPCRPLPTPGSQVSALKGDPSDPITLIVDPTFELARPTGVTVMGQHLG